MYFSFFDFLTQEFLNVKKTKIKLEAFRECASSVAANERNIDNKKKLERLRSLNLMNLIKKHTHITKSIEFPSFSKSNFKDWRLV